MKFTIITFGCWLNKADSNIVITKLIEKGFKYVNKIEDADLIIVNTCAVREDSELKAFKKLKELKPYVEQGKKIIVMGCLTKVKPNEILNIIPNVSLVDPNNVENIDAIVQDLINGKSGIYFSNDRSMNILPEYIPEIHGPIYVVPIQVGCLCSCTFCVTKFARDVCGKVKSYPIDLIIEKIKKAIQKGAREIYLTGQDVACYGFDKGYDLADLLEKILKEVEGKYFIRIGMSEPSEYSKIIDRVLDIMKNDERVYRFFHIPVQSGSNKVLKLMRRKYTVEEFIELINKIKKTFPDANLVTDVIVGFPGESDEDFQLTIELVKKIEFDKVHVARYSPRPFTEGELMKPKIPDPIKKERSKILTKIVNEIAFRKNMKYVGTIQKVVFSTLDSKNERVMARTLNYKPVIVINTSIDYLGSIAKVNIENASITHLTGNVIEFEEITKTPYVKTIEILEEDSS